MVVRPSDWFLVGLPVDPTPGDAFGIRALAQKYADIAQIAGEASSGVRNARSSGSASAWVGDAAEVFRDRSSRMPGELLKANDSYQTVADALRAWAESVDDTQAQADRGLQQAREAAADRARALAALGAAELSWTTVHAQQLTYQTLQKAYSIVPPPPGVTMPTDYQLRSVARNAQHAQASIASAQHAVADADARLAAARRLVLDAKAARDDAERRTVHQIHEAQGQAVKPSSVWEAIQDSAAWQAIVVIATVVLTIVSIVAIFVGGPLVWALIIAATVLLMVNALMSIAQGKDAWGELALLAVGLIPGGRLLALGGKVAMGVSRLGSAGAHIVESLGRTASTVQRVGAAVKAALTKALTETALIAAFLRGPGESIARVGSSILGHAAEKLPSGIQVRTWRIYGVERDPVGVQVYGHPSGPFGESWATRDPMPNADYRYDAGLPEQNAGRFEIEGTVDLADIEMFRPALPIGDKLGGLPELVIPNAENVVSIRSIVGLNESWTTNAREVLQGGAGIPSHWAIPDSGWY